MKKYIHFPSTFKKAMLGLSILIGSLSNLGHAQDQLGLLPLSSLRVSDAQAYETCPAVNPSIRHADFVVILQRQANGPINTETVEFSTHDGTALSGVNYVPVSGKLTFLPGETVKSVRVIILSSQNTDDSYFFLTLSNPSIQVVLRDFNGTASIAHLDPENEACRNRVSLNADPRLPDPPPVPK